MSSRTRTAPAPRTAEVPPAEFVAPAEPTDVEKDAAPIEPSESEVDVNPYDETKPATDVEALDPWGGLAAYAADAFAPPAPPVSPTILALVDQVKLAPVVIVVEGWDKARLSKFTKAVKAQKSRVGERRFFIKAGTVEATGQAALRISLSKVAAPVAE